jgi:hypothetical protein
VQPQIRTQRLAEQIELGSPAKSLHRARGYGRDRGDQDEDRDNQVQGEVAEVHDQGGCQRRQRNVGHHRDGAGEATRPGSLQAGRSTRAVMASLPVGNGRLHGRTSSCGADRSHARSVLQDRVAGTTPAANHPGWPGGRRVYRRVGVRSLLAQQHHAQSVQTLQERQDRLHYGSGSGG